MPPAAWTNRKATLLHDFNPVKSSILEETLKMWPPRLRPWIAMACGGIEVPQWGVNSNIGERSIQRWLMKTHTFPAGGARKLAEVFDVDPKILFEEYEITW